MPLHQAWTRIALGAEYERHWYAFDDRFAFQPRVSLSRTAIQEPPGSVTLSLAPIFQAGPAGFASGEGAVNAEALRAFVTVFQETDRLLVLDWQHEGYWFRPHLHAVNEDAWPVTPFPDGDYYVFLAEDMTAGTFGHPWEQTLCVFGDELVDQLVPPLATWLPVLRHGQERPAP